VRGQETGGADVRKILFPVLTLLATTSTLAARPSTLDMTCAEAAALVASRGAIVLTTGQFTYERYVAHRGFCSIGEVTRPAYAPTLDTPTCSIGYRCEFRHRVQND
jgi:hypothetical protein